MSLNKSIRHNPTRRQLLEAGLVVPQVDRCVQCGICSFYCPINIDVRRFAWLGKPVQDSHCLTCGECVTRCPRRVLSFVTNPLFEETNI